MLSDKYLLYSVCVSVCVCGHVRVFVRVCLSAERLFSKYGHYDAELSLRGLWWKLTSDSQGQKRGDSWTCQHPQQEPRHPGAQRGARGDEPEKEKEEEAGGDVWPTVDGSGM